MPPRKLRKRVGGVIHLFERFKRLCQPRNQLGGLGKRIVSERRTLIGRMQFARFAVAEFSELRAKALQRCRQAVGSGTRPRSAQDCALKRSNRTLARLEVKPQQG